MQAIISLIAISIMAYLAQCNVEPFKPIGGTTSGKRTLYSDSMTPVSATSTYQIAYATPKTINPKIIICIADYEERDLMTGVSFKLAIFANTLASFSVDLNCAGSALVYLVSIMHISL